MNADNRHSFQEGDYVVFNEVEGMTEINNLKPAKIIDCKAYSFKIELDTRNFGNYIRQGRVENKKVPHFV